MTKGYVFKKRLLKLANELSVQPTKRFYFGSWAGSDWAGDPFLSCGTTCCAMGLATTIPSFRRLGLRMYRRPINNIPWVGLIGDDTLESSQNASRVIFGTSNEEFKFLFLPYGDMICVNEIADQKNKFGRNSPHKHATAKEVAANIRYFVKRKYAKHPKAMLREPLAHGNK